MGVGVGAGGVGWQPTKKKTIKSVDEIILFICKFLLKNKDNAWHIEWIVNSPGKHPSCPNFFIILFMLDEKPASFDSAGNCPAPFGYVTGPLKNRCILPEMRDN
jgi:hypothetical protein